MHSLRSVSKIAVVVVALSLAASPALAAARTRTASTTGVSVSAGGTSNVSLSVAWPFVNVVKLQVTTATGGATTDVKIYKASGALTADLLYSASFSGTEHLDPSGVSAAKLDFVLPYEDTDVASHSNAPALHLTLTNAAASARTYDVTVTYEAGPEYRTFADVRDFGAKCDGSTDDSAAFRAAHDSLTSGGEIFIPPSASGCVLNQRSHATGFRITKSNITVRGVGPASLLKQTAAMGEDVHYTGIVSIHNPWVDGTPQPISNIVLRDFRIEGSTPATDSTPTLNRVNGVHVHGPENADISDVLIRNLVIEKVEAHGIQITGAGTDLTKGSHRVRIENCTIRNGRGWGIIAIGGNVFDLTIANNTVAALDGHGIEAAAAGGVQISDNYVTGPMGNGIVNTFNNDSGLSPVHHTMISGNHVSDVGNATWTTAAGVYVNEENCCQNVHATSILGNTIRRTKGAGILVGGTSTFSDVTIIGNDILDVGSTSVTTNYHRSGIVFTEGLDALSRVSILSNKLAVKSGSGFTMEHGIRIPAIASAYVDNVSIAENLIYNATTTISAPTAAEIGWNVENGKLTLRQRPGREQNFVLFLTKSGSTLQHRITEAASSGSASDEAELINGASATLANTPQGSFTNGFGLDSSSASLGLFDPLNDQASDAGAVAVVEYNNTGTNVLVEYRVRTVSGKSRPELVFRDASGNAFDLNNMTSGQTIAVRISGRMR